mmetsp:Transcript_14558/g.41459  ORF Transcript_14558/g.41459 Transcript_14558/m.41459 type:complete len:275 (-) Transcript_14558:4548-5372(-)
MCAWTCKDTSFRSILVGTSSSSSDGARSAAASEASAWLNAGSLLGSSLLKSTISPYSSVRSVLSISSSSGNMGNAAASSSSNPSIKHSVSSPSPSSAPSSSIASALMAATAAAATEDGSLSRLVSITLTLSRLTLARSLSAISSTASFSDFSVALFSIYSFNSSPCSGTREETVIFNLDLPVPCTIRSAREPCLGSSTMTVFLRFPAHRAKKFLEGPSSRVSDTARTTAGPLFCCMIRTASFSVEHRVTRFRARGLSTCWCPRPLTKSSFIHSS